MYKTSIYTKATMKVIQTTHMETGKIKTRKDVRTEEKQKRRHTIHLNDSLPKVVKISRHNPRRISTRVFGQGKSH